MTAPAKAGVEAKSPRRRQKAESLSGDDLREKIKAAKIRLPLPDLLRKLGFEALGVAGGNMRSPLVKDGHHQKTPSFSVFSRGGEWGWKDRSGGGDIGGDEITFLEHYNGSNRSDAIREFLELAGNGVAVMPNQPRVSPPKSDSFDWQKCLSSFTQSHGASLAKWRGIPVEFVQWLNAQGLIGYCRGGLAFPVRTATGSVTAAHIRSEKGRWFYHPQKQGIQPFVVGESSIAENWMVFESQWDAFAVMAAMSWHLSAPRGWAVMVTRGASNGRLAAQTQCNVYAWPQNDPEKNGKRPGEEWFKDVVAYAPGSVWRVATPAEYKDANDWAKAERLDVDAVIKSAAVKVEKPCRLPSPGKKKVPPATTSEKASDFNPSAAAAELGMHWLNGGDKYFLPLTRNGRKSWQEMGVGELRRKLKVSGMRSKAAEGESVSDLDKVMVAAMDERSVDFALSIAGWEAGVYPISGGTVLIRDSPRLIEPVAGDFDHITTFLLELLGNEQLPHFLGWLKIGVQSLREGERRSGQCLVMAGPAGCGKSRLQHQIITPLLGGRAADPKSYFFGKTDFNAELIGSEHLLIEEIPSGTRHDDRLFFGERIKEVVANDTARLHKKNRDALTVTPFWRLTITLNDSPDKLKSLPPITPDLADKLIIFQVNQCPTFWTVFKDARDPRSAFRDTIAAELPAFLNYLLNWEIPPALQNRRFGVREYLNPGLESALFDQEQESLLLLLIDKELFSGATEEWRGDVEDLKTTLTGDSSTVRKSASSLLNAYPSAIGQMLKRLEERFPSRFERGKRTSDKRIWIIKRPVESA